MVWPAIALRTARRAAIARFGSNPAGAHPAMTDHPPPIILGIESSCDEMAAAILGADLEVLASVVHGQAEVHRSPLAITFVSSPRLRSSLSSGPASL